MYKRKVVETVRYLRERTKAVPSVAVMAGTGLGDLADSMAVDAVFEYREIPHFPVSTVQSHHGKLLFGTMAGKPAMVLQGRFHLYEGYSAREVAYPVRVIRMLGVRRLVITNAAGGLNPAFSPGDLMLIADHINLTCENPLIGPNEDDWGIRFPDMSQVYDPDLIRLARQAGETCGVPLQRGVYAGLKGPALETPAEVRFLKTIGAEAVGFSTVQEAIAGVHAGMKILGISTITNVNDPDRPVPATVSEIIDVAKAAAPRLAAVIQHVIANCHD